jgi:hypothetical protein
MKSYTSSQSLETLESRRMMSAAVIGGGHQMQPDPEICLDWGDAPNTYRTNAAANGARHTIRAGFHLGMLIDAEPNGQPSAGAQGDDLNGIDDEDGVKAPVGFVGFQPGGAAVLKVTASAPGRLDAWIDWNRNGVFDNPGDRIATAAPLAMGANFIVVNVPMGAQLGDTYARFRLSDMGVVQPYGYGGDGEVEDYHVNIIPPGGGGGGGGGDLNAFAGSGFDTEASDNTSLFSQTKLDNAEAMDLLA